MLTYKPFESVKKNFKAIQQKIKLNLKMCFLMYRIKKKQIED